MKHQVAIEVLENQIKSLGKVIDDLHDHEAVNEELRKLHPTQPIQLIDHNKQVDMIYDKIESIKITLESLKMTDIITKRWEVDKL